MSYKLKTVGQESLYKSVSFSPSDLLEPKRTKMAILDFSPCPGVFSGLGGWFLFQMASFGPLQSAGGVASSNFEFTHLSIHAILIVRNNQKNRFHKYFTNMLQVELSCSRGFCKFLIESTFSGGAHLPVRLIHGLAKANFAPHILWNIYGCFTWVNKDIFCAWNISD